MKEVLLVGLVKDDNALVSAIEIVVLNDMTEFVCVISSVVKDDLTLVILVAENVVDAAEMTPSCVVIGFILVIVVVLPDLYIGLKLRYYGASFGHH